MKRLATGLMMAATAATAIMAGAGTASAAAETFTFSTKADCQTNRMIYQQQTDQARDAYDKSVQEAHARGTLAQYPPVFTTRTDCTELINGGWEYQKYNVR
jgi:hypothetical protein